MQFWISEECEIGGSTKRIPDAQPGKESYNVPLGDHETPKKRCWGGSNGFEFPYVMQQP